MTRRKLRLTYIANDSTRKATFKKRKKGFMKKITEITTLCDVPACAIIYGQNESQPEVWPSSLGAQDVIARFRSMPEMDQTRKMVNQETLMRQRIEKITEQLKKKQEENREKEMTKVMYECLSGKSLKGLNMNDLSDLGPMLEQYLMKIDQTIESREEVLRAQNDQVQVRPPFPQAADQGMLFPQAADQGMLFPQATDQGLPLLEAANQGMAGSGENMDIEVAMDERPSWFRTSQEHKGFVPGDDDEILPFDEDPYQHDAWSQKPAFP